MAASTSEMAFPATALRIFDKSPISIFIKRFISSANIMKRNEKPQE
jgi:hypothetical protein